MRRARTVRWPLGTPRISYSPPLPVVARRLVPSTVIEALNKAEPLLSLTVPRIVPDCATSGAVRKLRAVEKAIVRTRCRITGPPRDLVCRPIKVPDACWVLKEEHGRCRNVWDKYLNTTSREQRQAPG